GKINMKQNIGPKNRAARAIVGALIADYSLLALQSPWNIVGIAIGAFMVMESAYGFCAWHSIRGTKDMR
ncbi:MAG TPA: DUF2892 domain-containing protein, partial [archaeon]|nr:DUF2892 domain-containing protein [archaeon]